MSDQINDGGPAFPAYTIIETKDDIGRNRTAIVNNGGMSLRDWFAGMALQGLIGHMENPTEENAKHLVKTVAAASFALADAMISERQ